MRVQLIAQTQVMASVSEILGWEVGVTDADFLAEFTARDCYQSHHRPNLATAENRPHLLNCLDHQHLSVFEHASVTFRVTEVSRSLSHELVRHRHFSPSQLSQRFVSASGATYEVPPLIDAWPDEAERQRMLETLESVWAHTQAANAELADIMANGIGDHFPQWDGTLKRKRVREAARAVMPNMTTTLLDITGNHRAWREFLHKRCADAADLEIQLLARECLRHLLQIAPNTYQDLMGML